MTLTFDAVLNSTYAALIFFAVFAAAASAVTKAPLARTAIGLTGVLLALIIPISTRSLFVWTASTVERPSFPGFLLLAFLAAWAVTGRRATSSNEFRFATAVCALAGWALYPGALGYLDYDPYVLGYGGYLLPAAVAILIAYALYRGYLVSAFALNVAIAAFLLNAGESRNLWDYIIDPIAWIIGSATWIALAVTFLIAKIARPKPLEAPQPSSGIGETPISH